MTRKLTTPADPIAARRIKTPRQIGVRSRAVEAKAKGVTLPPLRTAKPFVAQFSLVSADGIVKARWAGTSEFAPPTFPRYPWREDALTTNERHD